MKRFDLVSLIRFENIFLNRKEYENVAKELSEIKNIQIKNSGESFVISLPENLALEDLWNIPVDKTDLMAKMTIQERQSLLIILILLKDDFLSLQEIADSLQVSKNTVLNDINKINNNYIDQGVSIQYDKMAGYFLNGNPFFSLRILNQLIIYFIENYYRTLILIKFNFIDHDDAFLITERINNAENNRQIQLTDNLRRVLPISLGIILKIFENENIKLDQNILLSASDHELMGVFWSYRYLNQFELSYLTSLLLVSSNMLNDKDIDLLVTHQFKENLEEKIFKLIDRIENRFALKFSSQAKIFDQLAQHMIPAILRNKLGLSIKEDIVEDFIKEYKPLFITLDEELNNIGFSGEDKLPREEVAYITMIILSQMIESSVTQTKKLFNGIVVCQSGTSVSRLLTKRLKNTFDYIDFKEPTSARKFQAENEQYDFVFSTMGLPNTIPIQLTMSMDEEKQLVERVEQSISNDPNKQAVKIMSYISSYISSSEHSEVFKQLEEQIALDNVKKNESEKDSIYHTIEQVTIIEDDINWELLIDQSFEPMKQRNTVNSNYVEAVKAHFYENFEYQIIGQSVLLPHARPEDGVINADVQVNILRNPIKAPNDQYYKAVVALAPDEENSHLDFLLQLNQQLKDERFLSIFDEANSVDRIDEILRTLE